MAEPGYDPYQEEIKKAQEAERQRQLFESAGLGASPDVKEFIDRRNEDMRQGMSSLPGGGNGAPILPAGDYYMMLRDTTQRQNYLQQRADLAARRKGVEYYRAEQTAQRQGALAELENVDPRLEQAGATAHAGATQVRQGAGAYGAATGALDANEQFRAQQLAQAEQLQRVIDGTAGTSVAETQLRAGSEAAIRGQAALAASARGPQMAGSLYNAQDNAANVALQTNVEAATLRAKEQEAARAGLGDILAAGRQGDVALGQGYANAASGMVDAGRAYGDLADQQRQIGLGYVDVANSRNNVAIASAADALNASNVALASRGQNDAKETFYDTAVTAQQDASHAAGVAAQQARLDAYLKLKAIRAGQYAADAQKNAAYVGAAATLGAGVVNAFAPGAGSAANAAVQPEIQKSADRSNKKV